MGRTQLVGSPAYYMNPEVLKKRAEEGFTHINFGGGEWVEDFRIVRLFVFYHPDGRIATYEHPKGMTHDGYTMRGKPFEKIYTKKEFEDYTKRFKIRLRPEVDRIEKILEAERDFK